MNRFFAFIATGTLISLTTITSACTSSGSLDQTSSIGGGYGGYYERQPLNPACGGGFRPSDGRSCSY
ncbi:hypothetical protein [Rhizobium leguminosarum]|uniref:hypothetical protein n=1 Tax=Rhizobium leguminosarum TaxID=384 RepID=UPI000B92C3DE|nr:hypothetical protein [Rhizobium leguminosarum]ASS56393.1 hypothetical protein CHR56_18530 [Rhizobium leguminosarum bv. viciae]